MWHCCSPRMTSLSLHKERIWESEAQLSIGLDDRAPFRDSQLAASRIRVTFRLCTSPLRPQAGFGFRLARSGEETEVDSVPRATMSIVTIFHFAILISANHVRDC